MEQSKVYISILVTDDYLPGLLVLSYSLKAVRSMYPLHVLLTPNISENTIDVLDKYFISHSTITQEINNPTDLRANHRWFSTYSKLAIFDQANYKKIVYLDADMLVLLNIDDLFKYAHMSATNAGGMLPRKTNPRHRNLNSGLMVIEPSHALFTDMISKVGKIEDLKTHADNSTPIHGSDQDFINAYYTEWPGQTDLHLDHKYNMFHYHLDEYNKLFGYSIRPGRRPVNIIHYASYLKPWSISEDEMDKLEGDPKRRLELEAIRLWVKTYNSVVKKVIMD